MWTGRPPVTASVASRATTITDDASIVDLPVSLRPRRATI